MTDIETSGQAAEAPKPVAGPFAFAVFTLGIVGTELLAVPVLAGSAAYALGEARRWPTSLARRPMEANATITFATANGVAMNFLSLSPGIVAVPVMAIMMFITANPKIMGEFPVSGFLKIVGWVATFVMAASVAGMGITASIG